jgi:hypothetical protein
LASPVLELATTTASLIMFSRKNSITILYNYPQDSCPANDDFFISPSSVFLTIG